MTKKIATKLYFSYAKNYSHVLQHQHQQTSITCRSGSEEAIYYTFTSRLHNWVEDLSHLVMMARENKVSFPEPPVLNLFEFNWSLNPVSVSLLDTSTQASLMPGAVSSSDMQLLSHSLPSNFNSKDTSVGWQIMALDSEKGTNFRAQKQKWLQYAWQKGNQNAKDTSLQWY